MPKLLEDVRKSLRTRHYSYRTEETYLNWIRQYIIFHNKRQSGGNGSPGSHQIPHPSGRQSPRRRLDPEPGPCGAALPLQKRAETGSAVARKCRAGQTAKPAASGVNKTRGQEPALPTRATELASSKFALWCRPAPGRMFALEGEGSGFGCNQIVVREAKGNKDRVTML